MDHVIFPTMQLFKRNRNLKKKNSKKAKTPASFLAGVF